MDSPYTLAGRETATVIALNIANITYLDNPSQEQYRQSELVTAEAETYCEGQVCTYCTCFRTTASIQVKWQNQYQAVLNICRTFLIFFFIMFDIIYNTIAAKAVIVDPLHRMLNKVRQFAENPLSTHSVKIFGDDSENSEENELESAKIELKILESAIEKFC